MYNKKYKMKTYLKDGITYFDNKIYEYRKKYERYHLELVEKEMNIYELNGMENELIVDIQLNQYNDFKDENYEIINNLFVGIHEKIIKIYSSHVKKHTNLYQKTYYYKQI